MVPSGPGRVRGTWVARGHRTRRITSLDYGGGVRGASQPCWHPVSTPARHWAHDLWEQEAALRLPGAGPEPRVPGPWVTLGGRVAARQAGLRHEEAELWLGVPPWAARPTCPARRGAGSGLAPGRRGTPAVVPKRPSRQSPQGQQGELDLIFLKTGKLISL